MTVGYDVLVDLLDRANYSTLYELSNYLESMGVTYFYNRLNTIIRKWQRKWLLCRLCK